MGDIFWSTAASELQHRQSSVLISFPDTFGPVDASETTQFSLHFPDRGTFQYALHLNTQRWAEQWQTTGDAQSHAGTASWFNAIRFLATTSTEQPFRCGDFLHLCNDMGFDILRLICPATCGCNDHASGIYQTAGCPVLSAQVASAKLESMQCVDVNLSSSVAKASW